MSLLATIALAASGATLPACSWDRPGINPFMGDVVAAVDDYKDIPQTVRTKLKTRMEARSYDEIATIRRDAIVGQAKYGSEIRDMHFGAGSVCRTVTRTKWTPQTEERGLVYCEETHCIIVPTVCRNVSRIKRLTARPVATSPVATMAAASSAHDLDDPQVQLEFDPPSAGPSTGVPAAPSERGSFAQMIAEPGPAPTPLIPSTPTTATAPAPAPGGFVPPVLPPGTTVPTENPLPPPLPAVPEPGTWATMLAGLATVAAIARRRRAR